MPRTPAQRESMSRQSCSCHAQQRHERRDVAQQAARGAVGGRRSVGSRGLGECPYSEFAVVACQTAYTTLSATMLLGPVLQ